MNPTPRLWNQVYTADVKVENLQPYSASVPNYLKTTDYLKGKLVKRISISALNRQDIYLNIYNVRNEILLFNLPATDIWDGWDGITFTDPKPKDRLYDLMDIDLSRSYWLPATSFSAVGTTTIFRISFYF